MRKRFFHNLFGQFLSLEKPPDPIFYSAKAKEILQKCVTKCPPTKSNCDGGIYVGIGGIAYALWYASTKPVFKNERLNFLNDARKLIEVHVEFADNRLNRHPEEASAFLLGNAGVYATAALIYDALGDASMTENMLEKFRSGANFAIKNDVNELLVGKQKKMRKLNFL